MKTKNMLAALLLIFLLTAVKTFAQPTYQLINNLPCDVTVNVEIGDLSMCTPYTPCNSYVVTIPAGGSHIVNACSGILPSGSPATGNIDELCVTLLDIAGVTLIPAPHHRLPTGACCTVPPSPPLLGVPNPGCPPPFGPPFYNVSMTAANWTIW